MISKKLRKEKIKKAMTRGEKVGMVRQEEGGPHVERYGDEGETEGKR